jgi:hypothetical protein
VHAAFTADKNSIRRDSVLLDLSAYESSVACGSMCTPSLEAQIQAAGDGYGFDPYEPYNEGVFDSCEENILDDSTYVYDYLNMMLGID